MTNTDRDRLPFFPDYAADELADNRKRYWTDRQWGWYSTLKRSIWTNTPKGKLPNDPAYLKKLAGAKIKTREEKKLWSEVMAIFRIEGEWLVLPEIIPFLREKTSEGKSKSTNAKIGSLRRQLHKMPADDPGRAEIRAELERLYKKTEGGVPSEFQTGGTSTVPPPKKSAATRGLQEGGGKPPPAPPENGTPTPDGSKIWFERQTWFRNQLDKLRDELRAQVKTLTTTIEDARGDKRTALQAERIAVKSRLQEVEISLGYRTRPKGRPTTEHNSHCETIASW
ncbi:MAG: hypothetical protein FD161_51 [Limisphaerales bacterium]|nr:MAG: hypothetical protein FD161_51 [Limisphaerales bacterium]KAG0510497.1 MAG: hypothetical protein E1N63_51 [Limisphaerales bacterium]TXT52770.1 MAG: hypothetical protein FD140_313 [Limisphaerales bacterium]